MNVSVEQRVSSWSGWPDDVRERLQAWNHDYLLSFRRGPDFLCEGCGRQIKAHPNGNAVVRPWRKAHGVPRCEDCIIALARAYVAPPEALVSRAHGLADALRGRIELLEKRLGRLRLQLDVDQVYIDALEEVVPALTLQAIRDGLRGRYRRAS